MKYLIFLFVLFPAVSFAQNPILDYPGATRHQWMDADIPTKRLIPYAPVAERDVMWSKRVYRAIDMREKINQPMYYPLDDVTELQWITNADRWSLWTIIRKHVMNGDLRVFSPYNPASYGLGAWDGDQFKYPIDPLPGESYYSDANFRSDLLYYLGRLGPQSDIPLVDEYGEPLIREYDTTATASSTEGNQSFNYSGDYNSAVGGSYIYAAPDTLWYESKDIVEYHLKEDWFFDKQRGEMDVRIIGIAPVVYQIEIDANGNEQIVGKKELFWLYFPHCRFIFNNYFTYNEQNDSQWMSFDDLFWKRRFSSYIYKESNVSDRYIQDYTQGVDALYESERITEEMRSFEHDVWSY